MIVFFLLRILLSDISVLNLKHTYGIRIIIIISNLHIKKFFFALTLNNWEEETKKKWEKSIQINTVVKHTNI
jgi:hypothetical protein